MPTARSPHDQLLPQPAVRPRPGSGASGAGPRAGGAATESRPVPAAAPAAGRLDQLALGLGQPEQLEQRHAVAVLALAIQMLILTWFRSGSTRSGDEHVTVAVRLIHFPDHLAGVQPHHRGAGQQRGRGELEMTSSSPVQALEQVRPRARSSAGPGRRPDARSRRRNWTAPVPIRSHAIDTTLRWRVRSTSALPRRRGPVGRAPTPSQGAAGAHRCAMLHRQLWNVRLQM